MLSEPSFNVLCIGNANIDIYPTKKDRFFGGSAANTAVRLAELSALSITKNPPQIRSALLAAVGRDEFGQAIRDNLKRRGVETTYLVDFAGESQKSNIIIEQRGERTIGRGTRQVEVLSKGVRAISRILRPRMWVHMKAPAKVFEVITEQGIHLGSLDLASFEQSGEWEDIGIHLHGDIVTGNEQEVRRLGGLDALWHNPAIKIIALKQGEKGATLFSRGESPLQLPSYRVHALDTTGAGDAFNAGIIYGLSQKWSLQQTGQLACALGALTCTEYGAQNPPITRQGLRALGYEF